MVYKDPETAYCRRGIVCQNSGSVEMVCERKRRRGKKRGYTRIKGKLGTICKKIITYARSGGEKMAQRARPFRKINKRGITGRGKNGVRTEQKKRKKREEEKKGRKRRREGKKEKIYNINYFSRFCGLKT